MLYKFNSIYFIYFHLDDIYLHLGLDNWIFTLNKILYIAFKISHQYLMQLPCLSSDYNKRGWFNTTSGSLWIRIGCQNINSKQNSKITPETNKIVDKKTKGKKEVFHIQKSWSLLKLLCKSAGECMRQKTKF